MRSRAWLMALAIASATARAQQPFDLDTGFRAEFDDWYVSSVLPVEDGKLLISGWAVFSDVLNPQILARLNADGTRDDSFPEDQVGQGKLTRWNDRVYVGRTQIVSRILMNGQLDPAFIEMNDGPYFASLQGGDYHVYPDGRVLMSGAHQVNYPDSNWVGIYNFIWFTDEGYLDTTRTPRMGDGVIYRFKELPDGKFICTGPMSMYEGNPTSFIFRVNADGSFDPSFSTGTNWGQASCYLPLSDGRCYVGGLFRRDYGPDTLQVVRLMPDGSLDSSFNNHLRFAQDVLTTPFGDLGSIESIQYLDPGRLLITGAFREVDGEPRLSICVIDTTGQVVDGYFVGEGCGTYTYQGFTDASIVGAKLMGDTACYIWGSYHGYSDGTTNDPLQRFVTRLYGPDFGMGVEQGSHDRAMQLYPNPSSGRITISMEQLPRDAVVVVRDAMGREVLRRRMSDHYTTLMLERSGVYMLELYDAHGRIASERVVVE